MSYDFSVVQSPKKKTNASCHDKKKLTKVKNNSGIQTPPEALNFYIELLDRMERELSIAHRMIGEPNQSELMLLSSGRFNKRVYKVKNVEAYFSKQAQVEDIKERIVKIREYIESHRRVTFHDAFVMQVKAKVGYQTYLLLKQAAEDIVTQEDNTIWSDWDNFVVSLGELRF